MEFTYELPISKKLVSFRLLNKNQKEMIIKNSEMTQQKLGMEVPILMTELLKGFITDIDGKTDRLYISSFVENMMPLEARNLRSYIHEVEPGVDMNYEFTSPSGQRFQAPISFGLDFFWLDSGN
jgi:hypothetical protein